MAEKVADTSDNADSVGGKLNKETDHRVRLCEPCFEEGAEVPAAKFCVECEDYLCETCVQYHRKVKPTKTHELINSGDTVQGSRAREGIDIFICSIHQGEMTHYCIKHDKLCCSKCVSKVHIICGDSICKVEAVAGKVEEEQEFKKMVEKIKTITVGAQENKQRATANIESGTERFEKEIEEIKKTVNEEITEIKAIELACDSVLREVGKWNNLVEIGKQTKAYGKLFIVMKLASEQLEILAETLQVLVENNKWKFNFLSLRSLHECPDERQVPILLKKISLTEIDASENEKASHKVEALSSFSSVEIHSTIDETTGSMFLIGQAPFGLREVTNDGEVKTIFLSNSIAKPGGIVLESDGTLLVSSEHTRGIKRVTVDGNVEDFITDKAPQHDKSQRRTHAHVSDANKFRTDSCPLDDSITRNVIPREREGHKRQT
ncbi:E3 ubiquitin-protein ligase TRIM33-like [Mya arenaria]|uniref:E3 ubiquitin-protein ligase TRIM33-like n=1 Tax=Mya arenaria TaxID=6604 RepID=UPI0022E762DB|nr:E3 ubiquitin-protein ligase TRIM33-like [Mya arenaria]